MTKISKSRMFTTHVEVNEERLKQMTKAPELAAEAMQAGAEYWHSGVLPQHFKSGAGAKYGYAPRGIPYLNRRDKSGKPPLVFSGSLRNDIIQRAQFENRARGAVTLKMWARVLNLVPAMPENTDSLTVKLSDRDYPNLKREIRVLLADEKEAIAKVITEELSRLFDR